MTRFYVPNNVFEQVNYMFYHYYRNFEHDIDLFKRFCNHWVFLQNTKQR